MSAIKLHWWADVPNFGDGINPMIVEYVSGRSVEHASTSDCELVAIGSILNRVSKAVLQQQGPRKFIWGTGSFQKTVNIREMGQADHATFASVRGPITAHSIGRRDLPFGDAGLLVDKVFGSRPKETKIGLIPHRSQISNRAFREPLLSDDRFTLIDVRNPDPGEVVRQISACEIILSGSLHGLVVADSYQIPNIWLDGPGMDGHTLKFLDYALSVGRSFSGPVSLEDALGQCERGFSYGIDYLGRIETAKDSIYKSFPAHLKVSSTV